MTPSRPPHPDQDPLADPLLPLDEPVAGSSAQAFPGDGSLVPGGHAGEVPTGGAGAGIAAGGGPATDLDAGDYPADEGYDDAPAEETDVAEEDGADAEEPDIADKLGEGMAEREDEHRVGRRTLWLAVAGLLVGLAAALTLLYVLLPEPRSIPDVRPSLKNAAQDAQSDLLDVHSQNLDQLLQDPARAGEPVVSVVCGLEKGDAPRKQRCELRATSYVAVSELADGTDRPADRCGSKAVDLDVFPPMVSRAEGGCATPVPFAWWPEDGKPPVEGQAGWYLKGTAPAGADGRVAVTTRHELGTYDIGDCPESGCGVGQIQLPTVDYRSDGKA